MTPVHSRFSQQDVEYHGPRLRRFGYQQEYLEMLLGPMARSGEEPLSSMAKDTPPVVLSDLLRASFDFDVGRLMNLRIHEDRAAQIIKNLSRHKLVNLRSQTRKACIHFSNPECFTVLSSKHPSTSLAF